MELSRETAIRRDARGRWFDGPDPIGHPAIERAFDRWIDRAPDGRYCLKNEINWAYVSIEGAPIFVRSVRFDDAGAPLLALSDGRSEPLDAATLRLGPDGALYCTVRAGTFPASFDRRATLELGERLAEDAAGLYFDLPSGPARPAVIAEPLSALP